MKIAIIPDIHGRTFWTKIKDKVELFDHIVFLGDYLDPYRDEDIDFPSAIENFEEIIQFKRDNPLKVHLLLGNHDGQYMGWSHTYSRYSAVHSDQIQSLFMENIILFNLALRLKNILFTHAGVSNIWLDQREYVISANEIADKLNYLLHEWHKKELDAPYRPSRYSEFDFDANPSFADIGYSRGGFAPSGGPTWADVTDVLKDPAYKDELIQIFGHTQLTETGNIIKDQNCYMCDSREVFIWDDGEFMPYESE